jgi:ribosomal protein S18 acetylase RimI-like enzyme
MTDVHYRAAIAADLPAIVTLSLAAWAPVFTSFQQTLPAAVYQRLYPDWQQQQRDVVERYCRDTARNTTWVAVVGGVVAGFIVYTLEQETKQGVVELLAVDPAYQHLGLGTHLNRLVLDQMRAAGMTLALVSTGGDPGHAPARQTYEKAGYTALRNVLYVQAL